MHRIAAALLAVSLGACGASQTTASATAAEPSATTAATPSQQPVGHLTADKVPWLVNKRVLLVPLDNARKRVVQLEAWLWANRGAPDQAKVVARAAHYLSVYLIYDRRGERDVRCASIDGQRKTTYERFVHEQSGSEREGRVLAALNALSQAPRVPVWPTRRPLLTRHTNRSRSV
jgi:hypothetical protein